MHLFEDIHYLIAKVCEDWLNRFVVGNLNIFLVGPSILCVLQYALGAAAALLFIYAAMAIFRPAVNRVLLVDFSCFNIPQR